MLVLVEGPDDVRAFNHLAETYKEHGRIKNTFADLQILLLPVGGCDSVMHWMNLNIIKELDKSYFVLQDSDRCADGAVSTTRAKLIELGLVENIDFYVLRKRTLENYINVRALERLILGIVIDYNDFTAMKQLCGQHADASKLGGKKVADKHFCNQTFDELEASFRKPDGSDEFLHLYDCIWRKLQ